MNYFFCKLWPPRPDFGSTVTDQERALMREHAAYWKSYLDQRKCVAFGPVADPAHMFGVAVLELSPGDDPQAMANGDPVIQRGQGFRYEIHPMPFAVVRP